MRRPNSLKTLYLPLLLIVLSLYAGCSQVSLYDLVESEQEGEFSLSVESVNVKVDSHYNFTSVGGYLPYTYAVNGGAGAGVIHPGSGRYTAPGTVGEATVECSDGIGNRDTARVFIYEAIAADSAAFSIRIGDPDKELAVSGGSGELAAAAELGTVTPAAFDSGDSIWYTAPGATGTDYIYITDELDNSLSIRVEVLPDAGSIVLELLPGYAVIDPGTTQEFTISNTTGHDLSIALSEPFGTVDTVAVSGGETTAAVEYTAPGTEGTVFLIVSDDSTGDSVQAEIYVQGDETPLEITPGSVQVSPGSPVEFTASGGIQPYTFSRVNGSGTLVQTSPTTATATSTSTVSMIRVTDNVGNQAQGKIKTN